MPSIVPPFIAWRQSKLFQVLSLLLVFFISDVKTAKVDNCVNNTTNTANTISTAIKISLSLILTFIFLPALISLITFL